MVTSGILCGLREAGSQRNESNPTFVQGAVRKGVAILVSVLAAACTPNGPLAPNPTPVAKASPSPSASPSSSPSETPSPSPSPTVAPTPVVVPAWAALHASCATAPAAPEALVQMQGTTSPVLADVSNPKAPRTLCGISGGSFQPQLVTQTMISWSATQGSPGNSATSVIAILDLFTGTSTIAATWSGGGFLDGLPAWTPDRGFMTYLASDAGGVAWHVLSGGGGRTIATLGPVPGRGLNPTED